MRLYYWVIFIFIATISLPALSQTRSQVYGSNLTRQTMTAFVSVDGSWSTFESQAANSKETQQSITYSAGGYAGEERLFGIIASVNENSVPFSLNNNKLRTAFRDLRMQGRIGPVYPTIGASLSEVRVDSDKETTANVYSTGIGAGLGVHHSLTPSMVISAEGFYTKANEGHDRSNKNAKLGDRIDGDISSSFDLTERMLDLIVGYRYRNYKLIIEDKENSEIQSGAYAGLRLGAYF